MKIIKLIVISLFFALLVHLISVYAPNKSGQNFSDILTLLSITIGFTITALSIVATSEFSRRLYKIESQDNSKTLLHSLVSKFKHATYIFLTTAVFIIFSNLVPKNILVYGFNVSLDAYLNALIWVMTGLSIFSFVSLFRTFSKFVIKSASS